jgi:hemoglobin
METASMRVTAFTTKFALAKMPRGVIIDRMTEDLYELVGGRSTLNAAIDVFYKKVLDDDELRPFFKRVDMAHLRSRQVMFVSMLLGGRVYTGKGLHDAHALSRDHGLNNAHFDLFLKYFRAALQEVGVKAETAEKVATLLEKKRAAILENK